MRRWWQAESFTFYHVCLLLHMRSRAVHENNHLFNSKVATKSSYRNTGVFLFVATLNTNEIASHQTTPIV
jgi:hypothetical protein